MGDDRTLWRVGLWHAALVAALAAGLASAGLPVRGAVAGGAAMGFSAALVWAAVRTVVRPGRRSVGTALAVLKGGVYLGLAVAALHGWLGVDGVGFAAGVSCFPLAAVLTVLHRAGPRGAGARAGWNTGFPGSR